VVNITARESKKESKYLGVAEIFTANDYMATAISDTKLFMLEENSYIVSDKI